MRLSGSSVAVEVAKIFFSGQCCKSFSFHAVAQFVYLPIWQCKS